jgi:hypothetical protein
MPTIDTTDATRCTVCGGPFKDRRVIISGRAMHEGCSYMSHPPHTWEDYARLSDKYETLRIEVRRLRIDNARLRDEAFTRERSV